MWLLGVRSFSKSLYPQPGLHFVNHNHDSFQYQCNCWWIFANVTQLKIFWRTLSPTGLIRQKWSFNDVFTLTRPLFCMVCLIYNPLFTDCKIAIFTHSSYLAEQCGPVYVLKMGTTCTAEHCCLLEECQPNCESQRVLQSTPATMPFYNRLNHIFDSWVMHRFTRVLLIVCCIGCWLYVVATFIDIINSLV